jgi:hypothetical protein
MIGKVKVGRRIYKYGGSFYQPTIIKTEISHQNGMIGEKEDFHQKIILDFQLVQIQKIEHLASFP